MTKVITDEQNYYDIAEAIRGKLDVETLYLPSEMAAAIETIETGTDLTSEDEGKVVVEDAGSYVLAEQTSQTITQNGTYDTTTVNELIANISSGGSARNILSGDEEPPSTDGENGDLFILYERLPTLPNGGQHVEYLQSSGTQYIDTGVQPTGNHGFRCVTMRVSSNFVACARNGDYTSNGLSMSGNTDMTNGFHFDYGGSRHSIKADTSLVYEVVCDPTNGIGWFRRIDNGAIVQTFTFAKKEYTVNYTIILFGAHAGSSSVTKSTARIYRYTLYENGVVVKDYYPCLDGNGVACMWEDVAGEYAYNDGSGTFTYGNAISGSRPISRIFLKVDGAWVPIEGQDMDDVDTDGGSQGGGTTITIYDNPTNATGDLISGDVLYGSDTSGASFVFLFADNQQTGFTIGGKTYSYNDTVIGTGWNSDRVNAILGELDDSDSLNVAWNGGDGGNHVGTLIVINKSFDTSYKQTMYQSNSASQTIGAAMSEAYVLLLFCIFGGSATANITLMGNSIAVQRYATRFSNSIYAYASKLENLSAGSVVSVSIDGASSSNVIGIMGIFGD